MNVGKRIKELRQQKGWTQQQLADYAGLKYETLRKAESGKRNPKKEFIDSVAAALGVSPVVLMYGNSNDPSPAAEMAAVFEGSTDYKDRYDRLASWLRHDATKIQREAIIMVATTHGFKPDELPADPADEPKYEYEPIGKVGLKKNRK